MAVVTLEMYVVTVSTVACEACVSAATVVKRAAASRNGLRSVEGEEHAMQNGCFGMRQE